MTTLLFSLIHGGIKIEVEDKFYPPESKYVKLINQTVLNWLYIVYIVSLILVVLPAGRLATLYKNKYQNNS